MIERFTNLPRKRPTTTTKYIIGNSTLFVGVGTDENGKVVELFVDMNKEGSFVKVVMHCFAIAVSLGLQYGVPLERYVELFAGTPCEPSGPVDGHDKVKRAKSVIDLIFRTLSVDHLDHDPGSDDLF